MGKLKNMSKKSKISTLSITRYFLSAIIMVSIWIILFQVSKEWYIEDTMLWGFIPWSDAYFMFFFLFMIIPMVIIMIIILAVKKS